MGCKVDQWLCTNTDQFGSAATVIDNIKRQTEEMRPRYFKYGIPFDFGLISEVLLAHTPAAEDCDLPVG